jgi:TetR/AcrR family transcriptional regulator
VPEITTRNERRKARTVGAIRQAAAELFRAKGLQNTTIDEIADRADVSVGSVYFHFKSKEALYLELTERALDINERYMRRAERPDYSPLQRVLAAGDAYLAFHLEEPGAFRMIALRVLEPAPGEDLREVEQRIADRVERLVGAVESQLDAALAAGEIRELDTKLAMTFLWGAWNGVIALNLRQDRLRLSDKQLIATLETGRRLVLDTLATPATKRRLRPWLDSNPIGRVERSQQSQR